MELPKINYDDFYKFLLSLGTIVFVLSGAGIVTSGSSVLNIWWVFLIGLIIVFCLSIWAMLWAGMKWYKNQKLLDKRLENEVKLTDFEISRTIEPLNAPDNIDESSGLSKRKRKSVGYESKEESVTAVVSCQIASVLPNSVSFDLVKDGKVWFWIANHEKKKYLAYIKIKFFINDDLFLELKDGYYGGIKPWNLNVLSGIQAPGLVIPEDIKKAAKQGKKIKIEINCSVHDEDNNFVEKKLPQTYTYNAEKNYWYLEP